MSSEETAAATGGGGGGGRAPGLRAGLSKQDEVEDVEPEEDTSPSSEASDATIVPNTKEESVVGSACKDISPEDQPIINTPPQKQAPPPPLCTIAPSEPDPPPPENNSPTQTSKTKLLVRSHAISDDASPPPPEEFTIVTVDPNLVKTATLQVSPTPSRSLSRHKLSKDSSQGSTVSENGTSPGLSRDSSVDYTDSTGTDLELFLKNTLNSKQHKDRQMLLKLEKEMIDFIKDTKSQFLKFPQMTSYHRMLVHRVAAFFGLDHNVDQSGKSVVVNRTNNTRLPDFKFREHIMDECIPDDQPKRPFILKRDTQSHSFEEGRGGGDRLGLDKKSKSFEERVEEYDKARARIFSQPEKKPEPKNQAPKPKNPEPKPKYPEPKPKSHCGGLHPDQTPQPVLLESPINVIRVPGGRKEDLHGRPWSSTDSSGYSTDSGHRGGTITKASSFHGVSVLSRADSSSSTRGLSATDSMSSGMSSLSSPMTRPPTIPSSPPPSSADSPTHFVMHQGEGCQMPASFPPFTSEHGQPMAIWVATCLDKIPPGSVIINPQTCQPYTCGDGSCYRWPGTPSPKPLHTPQPTGEQRSFSLDSSSESLSTNFSSMGMGDGSDQAQQQQQQQPVYMMPHSTPHASQPQQMAGTPMAPMATAAATPVQYFPPVSGVRYMYSPADASAGAGGGVVYGHYAPATPIYTGAEQQQYYTPATPTDLHQQQVLQQQQQQPQQQVFTPQQQPQQQQQQTPVNPQQPQQQQTPQQQQQAQAVAGAFQPRPPQYITYNTYAAAAGQAGFIPTAQPQRGATPPATHQIKVFALPPDQQQQRGHTPDREQPVLVHKPMPLPPTLLPPHRPPPQPRPHHPGDMNSQRLVGHPLQQMGPPRPLMQIPCSQPPRMMAPGPGGTITPVSLPPPSTSSSSSSSSSKSHRARKSWSSKQHGSSSSSTDTPTTQPPPTPGDNPGGAAGGSSDLIIPSSTTSSSSSSSPSPSTA